MRDDIAALPTDMALDKQIATELALKSFALHRLPCGAYLIARWDRTAHAPDLTACRAFLDRLKGRRW